MIPYVNPESIFQSAQFIDAKVLTDGPKVREFEETAAMHLGSRCAVAVSSGTNALYVLYRALNLAGKKIIMPAYTWRSTSEAAIMAGARPIFLDVHSHTFSLTVNSAIMASIGGASAICAVDIFGLPADYEKLRLPGLPLIIDSAQSFGAQYKGKPISAQDYHIYSLSPTKVLTSSEGGLITTNDASLAQECRNIRRWAGRMTEYNAACALEGLKCLDSVLAQKREIAYRYREFALDAGWAVQEIPEHCESVWKDVAILCNSKQERDRLKIYLEAADIESRIYFTPAHTFLHWSQYEKQNLKNTYYTYERILCLPSWPGLPQDFIIKKMEEFLCRDGKKQKMKSDIA